MLQAIRTYSDEELIAVSEAGQNGLARLAKEINGAFVMMGIPVAAFAPVLPFGRNVRGGLWRVRWRRSACPADPRCSWLRARALSSLRAL